MSCTNILVCDGIKGSTTFFPHFSICISTLKCRYQMHIEKIQFFNFIWKSKRDKISRKQVVGTYEEGGLKLISFGK